MSRPFTLRAVLPALLLFAAAPLAAQTFTLELTRFGTCLGSGCVVEIADNGALDQNPAEHVIDFSVPRVGDPPTAFSASGRAIESLGLDRFGQVSSILMTLTDTSVQGTLGAPIGGQIGMISSLPLYVLFVGFVISLVGLYEFTHVHRLRPSRLSPLWMMIAYLPYQWILGYAALRAVWRQLRGMNTWEKTAHVGAHRSNPAAAAATQPGILFDKEEVAHV